VIIQKDNPTVSWSAVKGNDRFWAKASRPRLPAGKAGMKKSDVQTTPLNSVLKWVLAFT